MNPEKSDARRQAELHVATFASAERRKSRGFARGTLIHTPGGPVPIELLRPGYRVFSRAPDASRQAEPPEVKPITAVQMHEHTVVLPVEYEHPGQKGKFTAVTVAPGQPLWTLDKGWIWAGEASGGWVAPLKLALISGSAADCDGKTYKLVASARMVDGLARGFERHHRYGLAYDFRTTTYSIEVEGHHTFFAGPHGLLVGDSSRADEIAGGAGQRSGLL